MGWTFIHGYTRDDLVRERLKTRANEFGTWKVLAHKLVKDGGYKGVLWKVMELTRHQDAEWSSAKAGDVEKYIACDLLEKQSGDWGYKDLTESMHPTCSCPLEFLDMAPCENEDWRAQVRAWHTAKRTGKTFDEVWAVLHRRRTSCLRRNGFSGENMENVASQVRVELLKLGGSEEWVDQTIARAQASAEGYKTRMEPRDVGKDWSASAKRWLDDLKVCVHEFDPHEPGSVTHGMFARGYSAVFDATMAQLCS